MRFRPTILIATCFVKIIITVTVQAFNLTKTELINDLLYMLYIKEIVKQ